MTHYSSRAVDSEGAYKAVKVATLTFDGSGDGELFIKQFFAVAEASERPDDIARLQLSNALQDEAVDCGRADSLPAVMETLRMKFGTTDSETQALLAITRRDNRTTLQEYASQVSRLVTLNYQKTICVL